MRPTIFSLRKDLSNLAEVALDEGHDPQTVYNDMEKIMNDTLSLREVEDPEEERDLLKSRDYLLASLREDLGL